MTPPISPLPEQLRDDPALPTRERSERGNARNLLAAASRATTGACSLVESHERAAAERLVALGLGTIRPVDPTEAGLSDRFQIA